MTPPKPTLQDVEQLDAGSDYRAYVARDVDPQVRNAAFKKLFHSDPHFNVMDGLDVYIDDYNTPNPLPVAIMKTLVQARALGLIDDELKEQDPPQADSSSAVESAHGDEGNTEIAAAEPSSAVGEDGLVEPSSPASTPVESSWTIDQDPEPEPLVELKLVPDTACNDEPLSLPSDGPTAAGTVVPFPRRPGSADPV